MSKINILIIEDEAPQIQVYEDVISQYNKKNELQFEYKICKSYREGEDALLTPYFDAAIIDLKLSNSEELEGKKLVESVYQKIRIPIVIYSGSIAQVDDIKENALLMKKLRTEQLSDILLEIVKIYNTGITRFLRPFGTIDTNLTKIFWNHLSNDLETWIKHNNPNNLLRYILSHFQEHLDINLQGDFDEYHPFEVYIKPPIKKNIHTGDLIKFKNEFFIVLTPACDIVIQSYREIEGGGKEPIRKAQNLILVKAKEFDYKNLCKDRNGNINKGKIKEYVKNESFRFHYLPKYEGNNGFIVDFQDITSIGFTNELERVATISSPFIKDIISRFANYYSRQGQPTFNQDAIIEELFNKK
jgi:ActR/RegA family two-component response regulator